MTRPSRISRARILEQLRLASRRGDRAALTLPAEQMKTLAFSPRYWESYLELLRNPLARLLAALEEHRPDVLAMSALLTTTMPYMKVVVDAMKEAKLREQTIVMVGGAPLNEEFGRQVGADAYCRDAATAVETARKLVAGRGAAA